MLQRYTVKAPPPGPQLSRVSRPTVRSRHSVILTSGTLIAWLDQLWSRRCGGQTPAESLLCFIIANGGAAWDMYWTKKVNKQRVSLF
jgi:hypothetical protein